MKLSLMMSPAAEKNERSVREFAIQRPDPVLQAVTVVISPGFDDDNVVDLFFEFVDDVEFGFDKLPDLSGRLAGRVR